MKAMPFRLPVKGALDISEISVPISSAKWNKGGLEPTSVLDTRSPSPPSSTSTLSSSLGGSADTGVAAVSENPAHRWPPSLEDVSAAGDHRDSGGRKDEWASDLQPVPTSLEIGNEKCGVGMDDWENMLASSALSPVQEQSFFRWFMGDVEDPSGGLKQLLQNSGGVADLEMGCAVSTELIDPIYGLETGALVHPEMNVNASINSLSLVTAGSDLATQNSNSCRSAATPSLLPNLRCSFTGASANGHNAPNPIFTTSSNPSISHPMTLAPVLYHHHQQQQLDRGDEKLQLLNHQMMNQQQNHHPHNPSLLLPVSYAQQQPHFFLPHHPKRSTPTVVDPNALIGGPDALIQRQPQHGVPHLLVPANLQRSEKPKMGNDASLAHQHQQAIVDQLFKAAELVETGNSIHARGILARLNHQLPSPVGKPLTRAAFYFKEALQMLVGSTATNAIASPPSPLDVVFKISAYKVFAEISPFLQFANFTSNQALLEALDGYTEIHILDFDIGFGGQWASFMQELALKLGGAPSLKITAFTSPSSHDPLELELTRDNLSHFAAEQNISFEFHFVNLDSLDPSLAVLNLSDNEAVAVNLPVAPANPALPSLLRLVKQLNPKIVVSVDHGPDRGALSFRHHFLHCLQSYTVLLDSLDSFNVNSEAVQKIERYLLKPRIGNTILARHQAGDNMLPWRTLFASAGFSPVSFSNFTETQAECLVKRLHVREFHVEKRQASLYLLWRRGDLVSVSAWSC